MAVNKVVYDGTTLIDLSTTTLANASDLASGVTAYDRAGNVITGTASGETTLVITLSWDDDYLGEYGAWIPDCTFAEIEAAAQAGKVIVTCTDVDQAEAQADGTYYEEEDGYVFTVAYWNGSSLMEQSLWFDSNGLDAAPPIECIQPNFQTISKTYTPTTTQQTDTITYSTADDYNGLEEVDITINAVASGTATPASSISATGATVSTGTNTLTLSKTVSNTPQVSAGYISSGTAGNSSVSLTASVTTQAAQTIYPSTSDQTINSGRYLTGNQTVKAVAVSNTLTAANIKSGVTVTIGDSSDADRIMSVTGTYEGSGGSGMSVATATKTLSTASNSIQFTSLSGQPTSFVVTSSSDQNTGGTKAIAVAYDGTSLHGMDLTTQATADTGFTQSYSSGTLTITATTAQFQSNEYKLVYTYGGSSANIGTDDVQVGSGATSISFTGLSDEPDYFSCVFTSDFSTSSGYQRVISVVYDGNATYGLAMDSGAKAISAWTYTYNNGTLTITSSGTNNGGYFHQPGYYHLTYGYGGTIEPVEIEVEPLSVTANGTYTAPTGKAYTPVTVNVSGGGGMNVKSTTWTNSSTSTNSHQFTGLSGTPKAAFLRCTAQLTRSSSNTYYYIADIVWDGTNTRGNYHLRSNGSYNNVANNGGYSVTTGTNSITFTSSASSRSSAPGTFYNGEYELVYVY